VQNRKTAEAGSAINTARKRYPESVINKELSMKEISRSEKFLLIFGAIAKPVFLIAILLAAGDVTWWLEHKPSKPPRPTTIPANVRRT
jgi:hypothetical protein